MKKQTLGDFINSSDSNSTPLSSSSPPPSPSPSPSPSPLPSPLPSWIVKGTKKGTLPVNIETRRNGKVVVIGNVGGDIHALLSDVKRALGTGGVARPEECYIEIQGQHHERKVREFLLKSGRLVGVQKKDITKATTKDVGTTNKSKKIDGKVELNAKAAPPPPPSSKIEINVVSANTKKLGAKKVKAMKPPELKAHLQARGLSTQGNKKELTARLLLASSSPSLLPLTS